MSQEIQRESAGKLKDAEITLGLVVRVRLGDAERIEATFENLFGPRVVFSRWSPAKLWITDKDPREATP